jgi:hypothetical protein
MSEDLSDLFPFDDDGSGKLRVTPRRTTEAYFVLGWSSEAPPAGTDGKLPVDTGSGSYPSDSELTIYRLEAIGRWPGGLPKPGKPQGIRGLENFEDCPIPPPPIPVGPIPPKPVKDEQVAAILRGSAFHD